MVYLNSEYILPSFPNSEYIIIGIIYYKMWIIKLTSMNGHCNYAIINFNSLVSRNVNTFQSDEFLANKIRVK